MALLGKAAVAMWWNMAPAQREEFEDWHSHEHFPERMGIPGFLRGSRWSDLEGGEGFFVMYELDAYATLSSAGYMERLNNPTPWSTRMMPHHRDMVRSQCRVASSAGGGFARYLLATRLSPVPGRQAELGLYFSSLGSAFIKHPGGVALHVLHTETPQIAATREQAMRGGKDAAADWVVLAMAYDLAALQALQQDQLAPARLAAQGAQPGTISGFYQLSHTASASDVRQDSGLSDSATASGPAID